MKIPSIDDILARLEKLELAKAFRRFVVMRRYGHDGALHRDNPALPDPAAAHVLRIQFVKSDNGKPAPGAGNPKD